jgi:hypothetical protein
MHRLSPTLIAVFLGGICVGSFGNQVLSALRTSTYSQPEFALPAAPGDIASAPLEPGGAAFLAEVRAQQGSVLAGTSLESAGAEADRAEFTAALKDVREGFPSAKERKLR